MALDAVLVTHCHLESCAAICRHCGIRFLSHPRNVNRQDLLCPFGCRDHLRRLRSRERSLKYRQSDSAKRKNKLLNAKRSLRTVACDAGCNPLPDHSAVTTSPAGDIPSPMDVLSCGTCTQPSKNTCNQSCNQASDQASTSLCFEGVVLNEEIIASSPLLPYVGMVLGLIVGRPVSREELLDSLRRTLRQHSIGRERRIEYVVRVLNQRPP